MSKESVNMLRKKYIITQLIVALILVVSLSLAQSETNYKLVCEKIDNYKDIHAKAMTIHEFENLIIEHKLTFDEIAETYKRYMKTQKPLIDKNTLRDLISSKIDSLSTFVSEHDSELIIDDTRHFIRYKYVVDGRKVFSEIQKGDDFENLKLSERRSFDGHVWRELVNRDSLGAGSISKTDLTNMIYTPFDLLRLCMLRKTPENIPVSKSSDLINLLEDQASVVQEQLEKINGIDCLLVTNGLTKVYLDPERGFSVIKVTGTDYQRDETKRIYLGKHKQYSRTFHELVDYGNGIWLPKYIEEIDTKYNNHNRYTIRELKVNEPVEESIFEKIFEDGNHIVDETTGLTYVLGSPKSIERTIDEKLMSIGIESENNLKVDNSKRSNRESGQKVEVNSDVGIPVGGIVKNNRATKSIIIVSLICLLMFCLGLFLTKLHGKTLK